jgi:aryl-alcohol dehydrogenase-like predicted oxidoreductase
MTDERRAPEAVVSFLRGRRYCLEGRTSIFPAGGVYMRTRRLGRNGPEVPAIGLGCMGMSEFYGPADEGESLRTLRCALEHGMMLDTADCYGAGRNEELVGKALREWGGASFVATKFGISRKPGEYRRTVDNGPGYIRQSVEGSLRRLGREWIDLYYVHRLDHSVPVEETALCLADLVREGKIRWIGFSEISAATLMRAVSVHPVAAVQTEYSLFTREVEKKILPVLRQCGTALVPYSPLGRGFLSGKLDRKSMKAEGDFRKILPRMSGENYDHNRALVDKLGAIAAEHGCTPAQLALAWVLARGDDIVPIPGTKREKYLIENIAAAEIALDPGTMRRLEDVFHPGVVCGDRYTEEGMVGIEE